MLRLGKARGIALFHYEASEARCWKKARWWVVECVSEKFEVLFVDGIARRLMSTVFVALTVVTILWVPVFMPISDAKSSGLAHFERKLVDELLNASAKNLRYLFVDGIAWRLMSAFVTLTVFTILVSSCLWLVTIVSWSFQLSAIVDCSNLPVQSKQSNPPKCTCRARANAGLNLTVHMIQTHCWKVLGRQLMTWPSCLHFSRCTLASFDGRDRQLIVSAIGDCRLQ